MNSMSLITLKQTEIFNTTIPVTEQSCDELINFLKCKSQTVQALTIDLKCTESFKSIDSLLEQIAVLYQHCKFTSPFLDVDIRLPDLDQLPLVSRYNHVAVGGTFDNLHIGHKVLLTLAAACSLEKLSIGVTTQDFVRGKKLSALIETFEDRCKNVEIFVNRILPLNSSSKLTIKTLPISSIHGFAGEVEDIQCLVTSQETQQSIISINAERKINQFNSLIHHIAPVVKDLSTQTKISSTNSRVAKLGNYIPTTLLNKTNEMQQSDKIKPYVIGICGSISSGKSSICNFLCKHQDCIVIDCDKLGHKAYSKHSPTYNLLISNFGQQILNKDTKEIDRNALSEIICVNTESKNGAQIQQLNEIVWPAIHKQILSMLMLFSSSDTVFIEAALLIEANWTYLCKEVWLVVADEQESIRRLSSRNNRFSNNLKVCNKFSMDDRDRIAYANVILSTHDSIQNTQNLISHVYACMLKRKMQSTN